MDTLQVSMKNRSGYTLRGIVTLPDSKGTFPCVLLLHGFTGTLSGYNYMNTRIARDLAGAGIACVRFDFFGCGESDGEFQDIRFTGLYEDAEDMFSWMAQQPFADKNRLYLSGHSLGGYVAASTAPKIKPHGLILLSPGGGMWFSAKSNADRVTAMGADWFDMEGLRYEMSYNYDMASHPNPYDEAKGYEGPALLIRASDDNLVDEKSFNEYAACYNAPVLLTTKNGGHNFTKIPVRADVSKAMIKFVLEN